MKTFKVEAQDNILGFRFNAYDHGTIEEVYFWETQKRFFELGQTSFTSKDIEETKILLTK